MVALMLSRVSWLGQHIEQDKPEHQHSAKVPILNAKLVSYSAYRLIAASVGSTSPTEGDVISDSPPEPPVDSVVDLTNCNDKSPCCASN